MSAGRRVVIHSRAANELVKTAEFIAVTVSLSSARTWRQRIEAAIRDLGEDAAQWPEAEEAATLGFNLRCRPFGRQRHVYRSLFTVDGDIVNILRFRHSAQDLLMPDDV